MESQQENLRVIIGRFMLVVYKRAKWDCVKCVAEYPLAEEDQVRSATSGA